MKMARFWYIATKDRRGGALRLTPNEATELRTAGYTVTPTTPPRGYI